MFLGILRVTTILLFGGACLIVAPSCYDDENAWYITPLGKISSRQIQLVLLRKNAWLH